MRHQAWYGPEGDQVYVRTERTRTGRVRAWLFRPARRIGDVEWTPCRERAWTHRGAGEKVAAAVRAVSEARAGAIVAQADRRRGGSVLEGDGELRTFEDAALAGDVPLMPPQYPIELPYDRETVAAFRAKYEGVEYMSDGEVAAIARCVVTRPEVVAHREGWLVTPFGCVRPRERGPAS